MLGHRLVANEAKYSLSLSNCLRWGLWIWALIFGPDLRFLFGLSEARKRFTVLESEICHPSCRGEAKCLSLTLKFTSGSSLEGDIFLTVSSSNPKLGLNCVTLWQPPFLTSPRAFSVEHIIHMPIYFHRIRSPKPRNTSVTASKSKLYNCNYWKLFCFVV